ncbi:MAG: deoxyribodipyrimidine photo-lyase [Nocardioidaceae bacterium]|nr:deoxyribodipyrimidine photo-lyase [Nocardioidaceae bacterium]
MACSVMWFRRDLRLGDNPALLEAAASGDTVLPLFVLDPRLWDSAGRPRQAYLLASLESLRAQIGGLVVRCGDPAQEVARVVAEAGASNVYIAADYGPYGTKRDADVQRNLHDVAVPLVRVGSPYAVAPGRVLNQQGNSYQVFTPFATAWRHHGWRAPVEAPSQVKWDWSYESASLPEARVPDGITLPTAGEEAALTKWRAFASHGLATYDVDRNRPDLDATSRMSVHLKWGEIHPRTMLADLALSDAPEKAVDRFRTELAWREFYADVLARRPDSATEYYRPQLAAMAYDEPGDQFVAWQEGRTGFPIVDAGMRQLRAEGWMHNRVRMIVASFLVKDLHIDWRHGARYFMDSLVDADGASNQHGWQWVAGSGTDAAPYYRVFNPIDQGKKFDPQGVYIKRYVAELRDCPLDELHRPHNPIVDHAEERREALARYEAVRSR